MSAYKKVACINKHLMRCRYALLVQVLFFICPAYSQMTKRFPLACRSRYPSPYTFQAMQWNKTRVCMTLKSASCGNNAKCETVKTNLRKLMIATRQSSQCGAKSPLTSRSPFTTTLTTPKGEDISGLNTGYFHHTYGDTQTALDIVKKTKFALDSDLTLNDYVLCIDNQLWTTCLSDNNQILVTTYDVSDHSCSSPLIVDILPFIPLMPPKAPPPPAPPRYPAKKALILA